MDGVTRPFSVALPTGGTFWPSRGAIELLATSKWEFAGEGKSTLIKGTNQTEREQTHECPALRAGHVFELAQLETVVNLGKQMTEVEGQGVMAPEICSEQILSEVGWGRDREQND